MKVQLYEWLKGDGSAWINTKLQGSFSEVACRTYTTTYISNATSEYKFLLGVQKILGDGSAQSFDIRDWSYSLKSYIGGKGGALITDEVADLDILWNKSGVFCNGEKKNAQSLNDYNFEIPLYLFATNNNGIVMLGWGCEWKVAYLRAKSTQGEIHLKPCKLLSPYQSHNAGECAMIDVLSNTLYFNEGSGSFSVEGEAGEVIDTTPAYNNIISKESTKAVRLRESINLNGGYIDTNIKSAENITLNADFRIDEMHLWDNLLGVEDGDNVGNLRIDGDGLFFNSIYLSKPLIMASNNTIAIGGLNRNGKILVGVICAFKSIAINDHIFHPCELALPYDNHPIGECCMIDLNSGDLYFNQGSGSFSCEGAVLGYWQDKPMVEHYCDVEGTLHRSVQIFADDGERLKLIWEKSKPWTEHRWLKGDGVAFINTNIQAPTNGMLCEFGYKLSSKDTFVVQNESASVGSHSEQFGDGSYNRNFFCYLPTLSSYNFGYGDKLTTIKDASFEMDVAHKFKYQTFRLDNKAWDGNRLVVNNANDNGGLTPNNIFIFTHRVVGQKNSKAFLNDIHISDEKGTEILSLTPAILNRPTLASEDNNGISRKQGEAVLVDEQRYKQGLPWVFGNVAKDANNNPFGNFKVSDYLIENEDFEVISGVVSNNRSYIRINDISLSYMEVLGRVIEFSPTARGSVIMSSALMTQLAIYEDYVAWFFSAEKQKTISNIQPYNDNKYYIDTKGLTINDYFKSNWEDLIGAPTISSLGSFCRLFDFQESRKGVKLLIKYAKSNVFNLIPVRLLRTIEPTCTHNGKGGKVGEIGFFDTISGKFFGNDGEGEFTEYIP